MRRFFGRSTCVIFILLIMAGLYTLTLMYPQPFFKYKIQVGNTHLYSDKPISDNAVAILRIVNDKISKADIYNEDLTNNVFISNSLLRFRYFVNQNYKVSGINYVLLNQSVFIRPANIEENRVVAWTGKEVPGDRTLDYYIAHEITHGQSYASLGWLKYRKVPKWVREGYADYIGKGELDFKEAVEKFQNGDIEMDAEKSGLYLRFHLLVSYLLDVKGVSTNDLFSNKFSQIEVENEIRNLNLQ